MTCDVHLMTISLGFVLCFIDVSFCLVLYTKWYSRKHI